MRALIVLLLVVVGGLGAWVVGKRYAWTERFQPARLLWEVSDPPLLVSTAPVLIEARARSLARRSFLLQVRARVLAPDGSRDLSSFTGRLEPGQTSEPIPFTLIPTATGPHLLRFSAFETRPDGSLELLAETERALWVHREAPPAPPPMPRPQAKAAKPPPPAPQPKGEPILTAEFISPSGALRYGERQTILVHIENTGTAGAGFLVELSGPPEVFQPKTVGPLRLGPGETGEAREAFTVDPGLPEGAYELKASLLSLDGRKVMAETKTQILLQNEPPRIRFDDPPSAGRAGAPLTFSVSASDDRGLDRVLLRLQGPRDAAAREFPFRRIAGDGRDGVWSLTFDGFSEPGAWRFSAEASDTDGKTAQTLPYQLVISAR